jgi:hypothetical protein
MKNDNSVREFRLAVLALTLKTAAIAGIRDPLEAADMNLAWCLKPIDKPSLAQSVKHPAKKSG